MKAGRALVRPPALPPIEEASSVVKRIALGGKHGVGRPAFVDDEDFPQIREYKWTALPSGYATRTTGGKKVYMHREIAGAPAGYEVDHIDHNPLNNTRSNLRICTRGQNGANTTKMAAKNGTPTTSRYKGVHFVGGPNPWNVGIVINRTRRHLGQFSDERVAGLAYDKAARKLFGGYACLNFPDVDDYSEVPPLKPQGQSGFYGVSLHRRKGIWRARICVDGKRWTIGYFDTPEAAARAYDDVALARHGKNAKLNFPREDDGKSG